MHVLIVCFEFSTISGQPMFVYELARSLQRRGYEVTIAAGSVGGVMAEKAAEQGLRALTFGQCSGLQPDVLHVHGKGPSHWAVSNFPGCKAIATIHSQWHYEDPLVDDRISHYACVRPQIREKVCRQDGIPLEKTSVIFNGIDLDRFKPGPEKFDTPTVLFVGTMDYLRASAGQRVIDKAAELGWEAAFIGRRLSGFLENPPPHVRYHDQDLFDIHDVVSRCQATAGILLGRTLLEGWACGIPGWVYEIDLDGAVVSEGEFAPPPPQLMAVFDIEFMTDCYEALYR